MAGDIPHGGSYAFKQDAFPLAAPHFPLTI
jgi:hypothetical protein